MSFTKNQLLPGENLVILARQHPLVMLRPILVNIVVLAILVTIVVYKPEIAWILAFYLVPFVYLLWEFLTWRKREYILTDRRVVKQEGVFSVSSFDAPLDKVNNVFHEQSLAGRIFKYGVVGLETASEQGTTVFDFLMRPLEFKNQLVHQREKYRENSGAPVGATKSVPQLIQELASLRDQKIITESEFQEKKKSLLEKL